VPPSRFPCHRELPVRRTIETATARLPYPSERTGNRCAVIARRHDRRDQVQNAADDPGDQGETFDRSPSLWFISVIRPIVVG